MAEHKFNVGKVSGRSKKVFVTNEKGKLDEFRIGMWIKVRTTNEAKNFKLSNGKALPAELKIDLSNMKVGIINNIETNGTAEVHISNEKGETIFIIGSIPLRDLTQCKYTEIPSGRRPEYTAKIKKMGYV